MDHRAGDSSAIVPLPLARQRTRAEAFHILAKMVMQQTNEDYVRSFLLTYKKFAISPLDIVHTWRRQFIKACNKQETDNAPRRSPLPTRLLEFLRVWVEEFTDDFVAQPQNASLLETIKERCPAEVQYKYKLLLFKTISSHQQQPSQLSPHQHFVDSPSPSPRSPHATLTSSPSRSREATPISTPRERANSRDSSGSRSESETGDGSEDEIDGGADENLTIDDFTAQQIAAELTRKEQRLFASIPASEFLEKLGFGPSPAITPEDGQSPSDDDKTPHINALVEHFNNVSFWVSTDVLMGITPKEQARKITKFIAVAVHLFNMHNFNGLMEIVAGLNFSSVKRLAPAWAKVSSKDRKVFEKLASRMGPQNNYKTYRQLFQKRAAPKLPYFAIILRDLLFVQVGNLDYLEASGLINFEKILLVHDVISDIKRWQRECRDFKLKLSDKHAKRIKKYMRRLQSIQDESILFFLSSLHEGENKKGDGEVGGMGALSSNAAQATAATATASEEEAPMSTMTSTSTMITVRVPPPRPSDASDPGEETGEEESSLSDISLVVTHLDDDDDDDGDDDDQYDDPQHHSPSPSSSTSSTSSSFSSLSTIAATDEIDFDAEAAPLVPPPAANPNERQAAAASLEPPSQPPIAGPAAGGVNSTGADRTRTRSIDNENRARQQLMPLPMRRGATNTEIYGSLRYSRKHAGAVQGPMDGSTITPAGAPLPTTDDSNFMRAVARRRELKRSPFGSVLTLPELMSDPAAEGEGPHHHLNPHAQLRAKRLCFAEERAAGEASAGPRAITERVPPLMLHRSSDERLLQRRRVALSPREKRPTLEEAAPALMASSSFSADNHRKRGSSWTGKSKEDPAGDAKKDKKEKKEKDKEKDKDKKRLGSLRILSPRRGSNSRAASATTTTASKSGTVPPGSPRTDRSLAGLTFAIPRGASQELQANSSSSRPSTPQLGRAAANTAADGSDKSRSSSPLIEPRASFDDWGDFEEEGDEEWEFGQWLENEASAAEAGGRRDPPPTTKTSHSSSGSTVIKSYWSRRGRVAEDAFGPDDEPAEDAAAEGSQQQQQQQLERSRKLTMPPCRICFTKLDADVRTLRLDSFLQHLSHQHGATHKEDFATMFAYQAETGKRVTVQDEQSFLEFLAKGGKRYSTISRQGPCSLLTYTIWLH